MTGPDDVLGFLRDPESQPDEDGQGAEDRAPTDNLLTFLTGEDETADPAEGCEDGEAAEWLKKL